MLEQIDLTKKMSKKEFKKRMEVLEPQLARLQRDCKEAGIPIVILFEGFGAAGKGYQIGRLIEALDPRGFYVHTISRETEEEKMHPFLWRYWNKLPAKSQMAIFDRSWYRRVQIDRFEKGGDLGDASLEYSQINAFERTLTVDGLVLIKLFLCIDQDEQRRRFEKLTDSSASAWRVTKEDLRRNKHFSEYKVINDEMLQQTDTACAPWTIVESTDREFATVKIYTAVIRNMQSALKKLSAAQAAAETAAQVGDMRGEAGQSEGAIQAADGAAKDALIKESETSGAEDTDAASRMREAKTVINFVREEEERAAGESPYLATEEADRLLRTSSLGKANLTLSLERDEYRRELKKLQDRIEWLHGEFYRCRISMILAFEGWDAGGKGGAIKRLTARMDPRGYRVNPTASPNDIERAHHYLWRFWQSVPKDGHIAIFDRSWYGRVMVERIEGFCSAQEWQRAYQEINEMERQFYLHGALVMKFWLQIDKEEQERRFRERVQNPEKQWKITDEDWRNRAKWDQYEQAVDEMLVRTSTTYAPWIVVEGNSKYYARVKVLRTVVEAMEARLKEAEK